MFKRDLMDQQEVFIPGKWVTKGLPTGGDYGFIPGPAAWESCLEGGSSMHQKGAHLSGSYLK